MNRNTYQSFSEEQVKLSQEIESNFEKQSIRYESEAFKSLIQQV